MLQVRPDRPLAPALPTLIRTLGQVATQMDISYFVIGATARDIVLEHVQGLETTRATRDVDFAVAVASWDEFERLKTQLIATGQFMAGNNTHRLTFGAEVGPYPLDLVPFDGVERDGAIAWPPNGDIVMNIAGYADAYNSALDIEIEPGFRAKIVSPPAMAILKVLAWHDRPESDKQASDVLLLLRNYYQAGQFDRLSEDAFELLDAYGYDVELAGAALLGRDAKRDVAEYTRAQVLDLFSNEKRRAQFCSQMMKSHTGGIERPALLLEAFLHEIGS